MSNLVIVAIPDENDRVWKVSSEKVPHLTVLFLGETEKVSNVGSILDFVEHAATMTLRRFYLPVDRRGELGEDKADVLFFKKDRYDYKAIRDFRAALLKDNNVKTAYDSAEQFDGPWQPHLTLGYPTTPANPISEHDIDKFYDVSFNKIAVWVGESEGPEVLLRDQWDDYDMMESMPMDMAMSSMNQARVAAGLEVIEHYGKKGMKWGVRNEDRPAEALRTGIQKYIDPQGHDLNRDLTKLAVGVFVPVVAPLTWPAQVRLNRAAYRGIKAKALDVNEKKFDKNASSGKNFLKIHNGATDRINREIGPINAKHPGDLTKDPAAQKKYDDEVKTMMQDSYRESANSIGNRAKTRHLDVEFLNDGMDFAIKSREGAPTEPTQRVKHAAEDNVAEFTGKIKRDATGHIIGFEFDDFEQATAQHSIELGSEFTLEHFGVKGQRWGVRKERVASGAQSVGRAASSAGGRVGKAAKTVNRVIGDVGFENRVSDPQKREKVQIEITNKAWKAFKKTDLPAIKSKPEYQKAKKLPNRLRHPRDPATKAYRKEVKEGYIKRLEESANSMTNTSGTRQYTIRERGWDLPAEGGALPKTKHYWEVSSREIKHAASDELTVTVEVVLDDDGFVTDIKDPVANTLAQTIDLGSEFILEHFGIKGMRWGVRSQRAVSTQTHIDTGLVKRRTQVQAKGGEAHPAHDDAVKAAIQKQKLKKSGTDALSNVELRELSNRLQLENQVHMLTSSKGKRFVSQELQSKQSKAALRSGVKSAAPDVARRVAPVARRVRRGVATGAAVAALA